MASIKDYIVGFISDTQIFQSKIPFYYRKIENKGDYNSYAEYDIPTGGRKITKTGFIEAIYEVEVEISIDNIDKFDAIIKSEIVYCTFPTTQDGSRAIINKPFFITNKSNGFFSIDNFNYTVYRLTIKEASLSTDTLDQNILTINDLRNNSKIAENSTLTKMKGYYKVVSDTIDIAKGTINNISNTLSLAGDTASNITNSFVEYQRIATGLSNNIDRLIGIPEQLANYFDVMLFNYKLLADTTINQANVIKNFFTTFNFQTYNNRNSNIEEDNYNATYTLNQYTVSNLFCSYCENIIESDFQLQKDLDQIKIDLENIYSTLSFIDDVEVYRLLEKQKTLTLILLKEKENLLKGVISYYTMNVNIIDFCYLIFGLVNDTIINSIIKLNPQLEDIRLLNGEIFVIK